RPRARRRRGANPALGHPPLAPLSLKPMELPWRSSVEVGKGAYAPSPLTDPDVLNSSIRFLGPWFHFVTSLEWMHLGGGSGYRCNSRLNLSQNILARCERRLSHRRHTWFTQ